MNFRKPRPEDPEINLIPFIDVLLVILIFLMLSTTYSKFTELQITLPVADAEKARDRPGEIVVVRYDFASPAQAAALRIDGSGASTTLSAVPQSPFVQNDIVQALALDATGTMLFSLRANNIFTHLVRPSADPQLSSSVVTPVSSHAAAVSLTSPAVPMMCMSSTSSSGISPVALSFSPDR